MTRLFGWVIFPGGSRCLNCTGDSLGLGEGERASLSQVELVGASPKKLTLGLRDSGLPAGQAPALGGQVQP